MKSPEELESIERRLVWIMGSPRSGSTWLLRLLAYPWGVGRGPSGLDKSRFRPAGPAVVPVNESYLPQHLAPLRSPLPKASTGRRNILLNDLRATDPAYFFSDAFSQTWREGARQMSLLRFGAQADLACNEFGFEDPLILIKEPNGSHAADVVVEVMPRCRMVFLLRDGRDVIDSMLDADSPGGWRTRTEGVVPLATPELRLEAIRQQAELWLTRTESVERACSTLGRDQWIVVRYEDLLADTRSELTRLDNWLGVGRSDTEISMATRKHRFGSVRNRMRGKRKGVRAASPGLWRENMTAAEQSLMHRILGSKLTELGYEI